MVECLGPSPQDFEVGVVLDVQDPRSALGQHHVGIAQHGERANELPALHCVGKKPGRSAEDGAELPGIDGVDDDLGMGGKDELRVALGSVSAQLAEDRVLEYDVEV